MTISDAMSNFGSWSLKLRTKVARDDKNRLLPAAPQELLDLFAVTDGPDAFLGHIIVTPQAFTDKDEVDVLSQSRYTGVLRESKFSSEDVEISGSGLIYWLGDLQERGPIFDTELNLVNESFADGITQILPPAITAGTIVPEVGTQSASYLFVTARAALEDWLSLFGAEYYVDPQGQLNAGTPASLFPTYNDPTTFVVRKGAGDDEELKPLPLASLVLSGDMTNFATKVISLVQVEDTNFLEGSATGSTSKRDLHGNLVEITDINNESSTLAENVDARAAARLAQISIPRQSVELSTEDYDIYGDFKPGDSIWVYDRPSGAYDLTNKIEFNGQIYFPIKLRVLEITYPVVKGMGVYFRAPDLNGTLYDLTPYVDWEPPGTSQIEVSAFSRSLIPPSSGGIGGVIAPVINPDSPPPIPDTPTVFGGERWLLVQAPTTSGGDALPLSVTKLDVYASTTSGFTPGPTNYIGYITVARGDINLGIAVQKRFPWAEDEQTYVRVAAVNSAGSGPASTEVAVTAGLIPSAAILDLVADKIAAGTITASITIMSPVIVGGEIKTAVSGQRAALEESDPDRISFYTGDIDESDAGRVQSAVVGAGATRQLYLAMASPRFTGYAGFANVELISRGQGGSPTTDAKLNVVGSSGTAITSLTLSETEALLWAGTSSGPSVVLNTTNPQLRFASGSRRISLLSTSANMYYGNTTTEPVVQVNSSAAIIGRTIGGRRLVIDSSMMHFAGSDNVDRFGITDSAIECFQAIALTDWILHLRAWNDNNHTIRYASTIDGMEAYSHSRFWIRGNGADVSIYSDAGELKVGNSGQTAGRPVTADDYLFWSDERLKENIMDLEDAEIERAFQNTRARRFTQNGRDRVGFVAQEAPDNARSKSKLGEIDTEALSLRSLVAYVWGHSGLLSRKVDVLQERLGILEKAKGK